jgi:hypothetical protein
MIDSHIVELACLHALGLLEQPDLNTLVRAAAPGSALQTLVRDLSDAAAALAIAASTPPPAALRSRVLAAVDDTTGHPPEH